MPLSIPVILLAILPFPGRAQEIEPNGLVVSKRAHERCVNGNSSDPRSIDCLNEKLKEQVDKVNPTTNVPPIDAKSPDIRVGNVNIPAVQQQYGKNFGHSVFPYRPPPPSYASPLGPRR